MEFIKKFGKDSTFQITQVIGLTNGFDNINGANYDLTLWVTYYNFLRSHKYNHYKLLNDVEMLRGADNMPSK